MEKQWVVTLTVRMAVKGMGSRDEAVAAALEQVTERIRNGETVPIKAEAKRAGDLIDAEHLFGKQWD